MFVLPDDPYARLGVSKDAQIPEIRQAHRKLVLKCHPDKVSDLEQKAIKQEEFQKVQRAYEMLSDSNERQKYDNMVRANEMEKTNARIRTEQAAYSSRTPPRREATTESHHYNVRMAEPRFERSSSGYVPSPKGAPVYSSSARTPPTRSYEENIYSSSYDDGRDHRSSRKAGQTTYEREAPSSRRAEEDKRSRQEADKAWDRQREKAEKDASRRKAEDKERERREKEKEKERRKKKEEVQQKERKRDTEDKRARHRSPYHEEEPPSPIIVDALHKTEKSSSKAKANTRAKVVDPPPVREAIAEDRHRTKADAHLEFAAHYLQTSRNKVAPGLARSKTYHPSTGYAPPVPTPPPGDDETVKRSSARRSSHDTPRSKLSSSHRKSSKHEEESPRVIPGLKKYSTMPSQRHSPPEVPESPPRIHRAQTDSWSRPAPGPHPGLSRAQTWYPAQPAEEDYRDRSRSRHQARYHSDEDYGDHSEDERYSRRPTRHHSPEAPKTKFRYTVEGSKAIPVRSRAESPARRGYKTGYYGHEANSGRPMASYEAYEQQPAYFPSKVKYAPKYDVDDVAYSTTSEAGYRMTEPAQVYGY
ncbi:DnaJ domain-containing protein [Apiospora phragmitis]|uniref:DnaJ domain-containing protein n=1 Tax=Apiospora phragmitis TaxID=2905665 RepID=A0ABR1W6V8_9PEZI